MLGYLGIPDIPIILQERHTYWEEYENIILGSNIVIKLVTWLYKFIL